MKNTLSQFLSMEEMEEKVVDLQEINNALESYQKESDFINNEIDSSMEAINSLETLITSLESLKESDYINKGSWELYKVYKKDVYRKNHLPITNTSLESFEDETIHTLVQVALEEDNNNKRNIFQKIWDFLVKMFNNFIGFIKNIFGTQNTIKQEIEKLKREISNKSDADFQGKVPSNKVLTIASIIAVDKIVKPVEVTGYYSDILKRTYINTILGLILEKIKVFNNDLSESLKGRDSGDRTVGGPAKELYDDLFSLSGFHRVDKFSGNEDYNFVKASTELPHNTRVYLCFYMNDDVLKTNLPRVVVKQGGFNLPNNLEDIDININNKKDAIETLRKLSITVDSWGGMNKEIDKLSKEITNVLKSIKRTMDGSMSILNKYREHDIKGFQTILVDCVKVYGVISELYNKVCNSILEIIKYAIAKPEQTQPA